MIVVFSVICFLLIQCQASDLIVQIKDGKVQGATYSTPRGVVFYSWRGIPFAKPPIGDLRFMPPQKNEPWNGILNATVNGPVCIFNTGNDKPSNGISEDCLTVNVYSPRSTDHKYNSSLPVMFWIYGGSYASGSGDFNYYDPTPLVQEGVIVVTFNYRLGSFGFLSTKDTVISGNAGLKDQLLALKWTKNNIGYFGGNPDNITIFGESAGGRSVGFHLISPKSKGLFNAAIMQSANALSYFYTNNLKDVAYKLAKKFDTSVTSSSSSTDVKKVLQAVPTDDLYQAARNYTFGPLREVQSDDAFISDPFYELIASGNSTKVPLLLGHNLEEGLSFFGSLDAVKTSAANYDAHLKLVVPSMLLKNGSDAVKIGEEIRAEYVGGSGNFSDNLGKFMKWVSDKKYVRSTYKTVILESQFVPVYMYEFVFYGTGSEGHVVVPGAGNIGHGDELVYLFNMSRHLKTDEDYLTRSRLVKLWTNFAKTHNPTPDDDASGVLQNVKWERALPDKVQYLEIGDNLTMKLNDRKNLTIFWDYIWNTYSYHPYNTF